MKHGLKALSLCFFLGMCMTTISTVSAQAAEWLEASKRIETDLPLVGEADKHWIAHSTVAGVKVLILCTTLTFSTIPVLKSLGITKAVLSYSGCHTLLEESGTPSAECDVINEPIVASVKGEQFLHNNRDYLYFSPETGEVFATVKLKAGCAIGESFNVKGHAVVEDCENLFRNNQVKHLITVNEKWGTTLFPAAHTNDLRFGVNAASLLGSEWVKLETGNSFSGNAL